MTLTEFLLARIGEQQEVAEMVQREAVGFTVVGDSIWFEEWGHSVHISGSKNGSPMMLTDCDHVLAECEAKRRIVEEHRHDIFGECRVCAKEAHIDSTYTEDEGDVFVALVDFEVEPCTTLRVLALPYVDHPDYRQEWAA